MSSSGKRAVFAASALLAFFGATPRLHGSVRLSALGGDVPPRLASRVATAVSRAWGVDTTGLVLAWGNGSLADVPDSCAFRLLGNGDAGWFAVSFEPPGRPARALRLRVGIAGRRLVAARTLRPGVRLVAGDIREESRVEWGPPASDAEAEGEPGPGWLVRRTIAAGEPLDPIRVAPPPVIEAGQPVRVLWRQGSVSVALEGTAMNEAAIGGTIRVRFPDRSRTITGTVTAPGEARMP
jgi:flagella basal body P-ring formation protein FlgA